ncbi:MAG: hypothetical protein P4L43_13550 [Syntrophobacteraceae bacterium]|nr:hypothetical protein [Syntrophobacteraceae bacterium]
MEALKTVGIKYCGGCNPAIDRAGIGREIETILPKGFTLIHGTAPVPRDFGILICGCGSGCAKHPELLSFARHWVLVCGTTVDEVEVPGTRIALAIVEKLLKIASNEI